MSHRFITHNKGVCDAPLTIPYPPPRLTGQLPIFEIDTEIDAESMHVSSDGQLAKGSRLEISCRSELPPSPSRLALVIS